MKMWTWTLWLAFAVLPGAALAQQDQGVITGRVTDASGAVLPGVTVTGEAIDTGVTTRVVTDGGGLFALPRLKIGSYRVTAELTCFKRSVRDCIAIHAQSRVRADFELGVGSVTEEVAVVATAPLLETGTSALAHVIKEEEIRELPLNGRNFQRLAVLVAGVLPAMGHRDQEGASIRTASGPRTCKERQCAAADCPRPRAHGVIRRLLLAESSAQLQHQRRLPGRSADGAAAPSEPEPGGGHLPRPLRPGPL